jgi:hypothetical protein
MQEDRMGVKCNTYGGHEKQELLMEKASLGISWKRRKGDIKM